METQEIKQALSSMNLLNVLDLYFEARTGRHCFSDEFLPVPLLAELHKLEYIMHQCNGETILSRLQPGLDGDGAAS